MADLREVLTETLTKHQMIARHAYIGCTGCRWVRSAYGTADIYADEFRRHRSDAIIAALSADPESVLRALGATKVTCDHCHGRGRFQSLQNTPTLSVRCHVCAGSGSLWRLNGDPE